MFETLDKNNDGGLAEEEFVKVTFIIQRLMIAMVSCNDTVSTSYSDVESF